MRYTADMGCAQQPSTLTKQPGAVRSSRRWVMGCSPEQIANSLPVQFPDDSSMRISHEAVHQALFVQGRGALKRDLVACLRTGILPVDWRGVPRRVQWRN
jgi:hypothetical protein